MSFKITKNARLFVFCSLLCVNIGVNAASISDVVDLGESNFDPNTNLLWLDLDVTANLSIQQIKGGAGGWVNNGWRYATIDEVVQLWANMGITYREAPQANYGEFEAVNRFFDFFGLLSQGTVWGPDSISDVKATQGWIDRGNLFPEYEHPSLAAAISLWNDQLTGADVTNLIVSTEAYPSPDIGSYLVMAAPVPEPPTHSLLGLGLACIGFLLRRKSTQSTSSIYRV